MEAFLAERARVVLWNRTEAKTEALADRRPVHRWEPGMEADAAFSTLAPDADLPALLLAALRTMPVVVDANYGPRATLGAALERPVADGAEMLRASARASFERFAAQSPERG
jgi:shikimate 5-dehydrogenase